MAKELALAVCRMVALATPIYLSGCGGVGSGISWASIVSSTGQSGGRARCNGQELNIHSYGTSNDGSLYEVPYRRVHLEKFNAADSANPPALQFARESLKNRELCLGEVKAYTDSPYRLNGSCGVDSILVLCINHAPH